MYPGSEVTLSAKKGAINEREFKTQNKETIWIAGKTTENKTFQRQAVEEKTQQINTHQNNNKIERKLPARRYL